MFMWDQENRLISAAQPSTGALPGITTFSYTDNGKKLNTTTPTGIVRSVWDNDVLLQETGGTGLTLAQYTQGPGEWDLLISQIRSGTVQFYGSDDRQNVRLLLTQSGGTNFYAYSAFGLVILTNWSQNPFQFGGNSGYYGELQASLFRTAHRILAPVTGRWISKDPIGFGGVDWSFYRYVMNNPVNSTDPTGLATMYYVPVWQDTTSHGYFKTSRPGLNGAVGFYPGE
jgi:RHS repeat-associated protein